MSAFLFWENRFFLSGQNCVIHLVLSVLLCFVCFLIKLEECLFFLFDSLHFIIFSNAFDLLISPLH